MNDAIEAVSVRTARPRAVATLQDVVELAKPRIVLMLLATATAGYFVGTTALNARALLGLLIGTALLAGGANAFNQYIERDLDRQMRRTARRPLPAGRIGTRTAFVCASLATLGGFACLTALAGWPTALVGAGAFAVYVGVYTPLKRRSPLCTLVGALPGAAPALMGWTAADAAAGSGGLVVFATVFLWQMPHFMAISWLCRDDYRRAGFAMLSARDGAGRAVARRAVCYSFALLCLGALPFLLGMAGAPYVVASACAGTALLAASIVFLRERTTARARTLFATSNGYLIVMVLLWMSLLRG